TWLIGMPRQEFGDHFFIVLSNSCRLGRSTPRKRPIFTDAAPYTKELHYSNLPDAPRRSEIHNERTVAQHNDRPDRHRAAPPVDRWALACPRGSADRTAGSRPGNGRDLPPRAPRGTPASPRRGSSAGSSAVPCGPAVPPARHRPRSGSPPAI